MALDRYRKKRDFARTPEPSEPDATVIPDENGARGLQFVVHMHAASHLHYDLRLELDGVLKCWAVPKGPSLDPAVKRLAVETEDHPLAYLSFEGVIPKGEYGGGSMLVWDRGLWFPVGDPHAGLAKGHLAFRLEGEKARGQWDLVRSNGRARTRKTQPEQWILIKSRDLAAQTERVPLVEARPESVRTGRTIDEVRKDGVLATLRDVVIAGDPSNIAGAVRGAPPQFVEPQLATAATVPPSGGDWLAEVKLDGYRLIASKHGGKVRLSTRTNQNWTDRFSEIARDLATLPGGDAVLDGEVVVFDARGRTDFGALQSAVGKPGAQMVYVIFDLLHLNGWDLRPAALLARKEALRLLLARHRAERPRSPLRFGDHIQGQAPEMHREAAALGLEGTVSKRADARYVSGRSAQWLKVKCVGRQELVIVGYTEAQGRNTVGRSGIGALLTGVFENGILRYTGKVGTGFDGVTLRGLAERMQDLAREKPAVTGAPRARGVHWVEPLLVAEVTFAGWSKDGMVRQASLVGLREDKAVEDVERETPVETPSPTPPRPRAAARVAGVRLTHPDKVMFPDAGITKHELAEYYAAIASYILPHATQRPLSLVRCPNGVRAELFFQKHAHKGVPDVVPRISLREDKEPYLMVDSVESLVSLVHFGAIEFHVRGVRVDQLDRPDLVVMDLDPAPEVPWTRVARTALALKEQFEALGLVPFLRSTGGKGLHVVVPIARESTWADIKALSHGLARAYAIRDPKRFTAQLSKEHRAGKIFIDYLRNNEGATAIAPWSVRARDGALVATPIAWDMLDTKEGPPRENIREVLKRVGNGRWADCWAELEASRRPITREAREAVAELTSSS